MHEPYDKGIDSFYKLGGGGGGGGGGGAKEGRDLEKKYFQYPFWKFWSNFDQT